ncbi:hypothetical protein GX51_00971 [Blastomyces parvus]|uniref:Secreted protein n=1 Tax=Blastomyces parvus TaxID=2060905 RepID=A0A2B7XB86_9EURO|nr:hypothetical protein GX51_00971 [Blastomyces parvus]
MRFSVPAFIVLLSFGSNALAAECYFQSGGSSCATPIAVVNALSYYCANYFNQASKPFTTYNYMGQTVWVGHLGPFANPSECYSAGKQCGGGDDDDDDDDEKCTGGKTSG